MSTICVWTKYLCCDLNILWFHFLVDSSIFKIMVDTDFILFSDETQGTFPDDFDFCVWFKLNSTNNSALLGIPPLSIPMYTASLLSCNKKVITGELPQTEIWKGHNFTALVVSQNLSSALKISTLHFLLTGKKLGIQESV